MLVGKDECLLDIQTLKNLTSNFQSIHVDIGTGDGKYIYKQALKFPNVYFIGIDNVKKNLEKTSTKVLKKYKNNTGNILFIISSLEAIPYDINNIADRITIYLPWGILLEAIVRPLEEILKHVAIIAKNQSIFEFIITYSPIYEGNEMERRGLPNIGPNYFCAEYQKKLKSIGLVLTKISILSNDQLKQIESSWAKRLAFGRARQFFKLEGFIEKNKGV